jgi:addiction module HigA family antidote
MSGWKSYRIGMASIRMKEELSSPGEILRDEFLFRHRITQDALADAIGMSRLTVNQLINGKRSITADTAIRLGKALGTSPDYWLNLQRAADLFEAQKKFQASGKKVRALINGTK